MSLPQFSSTRLVSDDHAEEGVPRGAVGIILDVYEDGDYEVEFSREDGTTIAWFAVRANEVEPADQSRAGLMRRTGD
ncbi:MAG TPA: DUF4926 domain-containing protein [Thermomicrobiales bacterium]|jgi:hypothetical protein